MPTAPHHIESFDLRAARAEEYASLNTFENVQRLEVFPDDPPRSLAEDIRRWQTMPTFIQHAAWTAWDAARERLLGFAHAEIYHTGDNPRLVEVGIEVLPAFRRQGLGTALLRQVAAHTRLQGRSLLMLECNDRVPAGSEFLTRIGGRKGLDEPLSQLRLADLDHRRVARWMRLEDRLSTEFELGLWDGPYPEGRLQDMADLLQVVGNDQPRDKLDLEDSNFTPDILRQFDDRQRAGGDQRWSLYLANRKDGRLAGVTEVYWNPSRPSLLTQGFTGVMPEYRSRGLGRWLKAAMLTKILRERPQVQVIRVGNAASNVPMLKINDALGFKPFVAWTFWQVELVAVEKYLASRE